MLQARRTASCSCGSKWQQRPFQAAWCGSVSPVCVVTSTSLHGKRLQAQQTARSSMVGVCCCSSLRLNVAASQEEVPTYCSSNCCPRPQCWRASCCCPTCSRLLRITKCCRCCASSCHARNDTYQAHAVLLARTSCPLTWPPNCQLLTPALLFLLTDTPTKAMRLLSCSPRLTGEPNC